MSPKQEPKYEARDGRIYNRASGDGPFNAEDIADMRPCLKRAAEIMADALAASAPQHRGSDPNLWRLQQGPAPQPTAYLLRDLAAELGIDCQRLICEIRDAGLGDYSVNMAVPPAHQIQDQPMTDQTPTLKYQITPNESK